MIIMGSRRLTSPSPNVLHVAPQVGVKYAIPRPLGGVEVPSGKNDPNTPGFFDSFAYFGDVCSVHWRHSQQPVLKIGS